MSEKKNNGVVLVVIIIVLIILTMGYFVYRLSNENVELKTKIADNTCESEITEANCSDETIPVEDLFATEYAVLKNANNVIYKISNNILYYYDVTKSTSGLSTTSIDPYKDMYVKLDTGVKRIKSLMLGAQHAGLYYLVIKTDGTVKIIDDGKYSEFEPLKELKVNDVIKLERDSENLKLTVELLDKTQKVVEFKAL